MLRWPQESLRECSPSAPWRCYATADTPPCRLVCPSTLGVRRLKRRATLDFRQKRRSTRPFSEGAFSPVTIVTLPERCCGTRRCEGLSGCMRLAVDFCTRSAIQMEWNIRGDEIENKNVVLFMWFGGTLFGQTRRQALLQLSAGDCASLSRLPE